MEDAVVQRRHAKKAFLKVGKVASSNNGAHAQEKLISAKQTEQEWDKCAPLQKKYLDAGFRVINLAAYGNLIPDNSEKCLKVNKDPTIHDICQELDQIFFHVVSKPTRKLRQCMDKPTSTARKRQWAHEMLGKVLSYPIQTFFKTADVLGSTLMRHIDETRTHNRLRSGLLHALMYISDCYRYLLEHKRSKDAAELMRILAPGDAEAHMRVAINLAMLSENDQELSPFFHYCTFLANRHVSVNHSEATVVSRYVSNVRASMRSERETSSPARRKFTSLFIDILWSVLSEDFDNACEKARKAELWNSFRQYLGEGVSSRDLLSIIGCLMFVHYRISPHGNEEGKIMLQSDLTETIVCRMISVLSVEVSSCVQELNQTIRGRKKNRRRAMQKKRKLDGGAVSGITAEMLGYEVLKSIANVDVQVPYLGALTFLTHYWSKARIAPSPNSDFNGMADALKNLYRVMEGLLNIEKTTYTTSLTGLIGSKIIAEASAVLPAMTEDIMFCNYDPCKQHNMFRNVLIQEVPFPSIFRGDERGLIKTALRNLGDRTYESLVVEPVRRHLEAFGQKCLKESNILYSMDKESSAALVILTVRKFRINRLILGLEKVGGGKLSRIITAGKNKCIRDERSENECEEEEQPPAAQPLEDEGPEQDSFQQDLTSRELGSRLRKRRRLLGTSTPADVGHSAAIESNSHESSKVQEESILQSRVRGNQELEHPPAKRKKDTPLRKETGARSTRREVPRRRAATYGGMLSQGSFQLTYTPPVEISCPQEDSQEPKRKPDPCTELSRILREVLYPTNADIPSPPRNLVGPAFWRNDPSDDYSQDLRMSDPQLVASELQSLICVRFVGLISPHKRLPVSNITSIVPVVFSAMRGEAVGCDLETFLLIATFKRNHF